MNVGDEQQKPYQSAWYNHIMTWMHRVLKAREFELSMKLTSTTANIASVEVHRRRQLQKIVGSTSSPPEHDITAPAASSSSSSSVNTIRIMTLTDAAATLAEAAPAATEADEERSSRELTIVIHVIDDTADAIHTFNTAVADTSQSSKQHWSLRRLYFEPSSPHTDSTTTNPQQLVLISASCPAAPEVADAWMYDIHADHHQSILYWPPQVRASQQYSQARFSGRIIGFYHICAINNYAAVVSEQLQAIVESQLWQHTHTLYVTISGPNCDDTQHCIDLLMNLQQQHQQKQQQQQQQQKLRILQVGGGDNAAHFERPILQWMHKLASSTSSNGSQWDAYWYIHSKGVSQRNQSAIMKPRIEDWRHLLQFYTIYRWRRCLNTLLTTTTTTADVNTTVGCNYFTWPRPHYSGNFWWARSDYIARELQALPTCKGAILAPGTSDNQNTDDYYASEMWICAGRGPHASLFNSGVDHYTGRFPASRYRHPTIRTDIESILVRLLTLLHQHRQPHWLAYGTLLAWRRHQGRQVIAGDDDGDLMVPLEQWHSSWWTRPETRLLLQQAGLNISTYTDPMRSQCRHIAQVRLLQDSSTTNVAASANGAAAGSSNIVDKLNGVAHVDIYMCEVRQSAKPDPLIVDHWNFWCWRYNDILPLQRTTMLGCPTWVPLRSDAFLQYMYGKQCWDKPVPGAKCKSAVYVNGFARMFPHADNRIVEEEQEAAAAAEVGDAAAAAEKPIAPQK